MYCKNCLKKISSRSRFCKYCGASVEEAQVNGEQPEEKKAPPVQGTHGVEEKDGYNFKLRSERDKEFPIPPKYIGIGLTVIAAICIVTVVLKSSIFQGVIAIDYSDYTGVWQERAGENVEKDGGVKLEILSVEGNTMVISMGFYDGGQAYNSIKAQGVAATIKDGAAYYTFSNDGYGNSGNGILTFRGRTIEWKSIVNKDTPVYYKVVKVTNSVTARQEEPSQESAETEETSQPRTEEDYVLPNSDTVYLAAEDLEGMTPEELRIARNEILARHGRQFRDPALAAYFESKDWYRGNIDPETFDNEYTGQLNEFELKNIDLIQSME